MSQVIILIPVSFSVVVDVFPACLLGWLMLKIGTKECQKKTGTWPGGTAHDQSKQNMMKSIDTESTGDHYSVTLIWINVRHHIPKSASSPHPPCHPLTSYNNDLQYHYQTNHLICHSNYTHFKTHFGMSLSLRVLFIQILCLYWSIKKRERDPSSPMEQWSHGHQDYYIKHINYKSHVCFQLGKRREVVSAIDIQRSCRASHTDRQS